MNKLLTDVMFIVDDNERHSINIPHHWFRKFQTRTRLRSDSPSRLELLNSCTGTLAERKGKDFIAPLQLLLCLVYCTLLLSLRCRTSPIWWAIETWTLREVFSLFYSFLFFLPWKLALQIWYLLIRKLQIFFYATKCFRVLSERGVLYLGEGI